MKKIKKTAIALIVTCVSAFSVGMCASTQKILSVDLQKVFENYDDAKAAQAAFGEEVSAADKELKEMYDEAIKLQEEITALNEKAENPALLESAREKFKSDATSKLEILRGKEGEFLQFRQDVNKKFSSRRNKEISEQSKAIERVTAEIAKQKKADVVLSKVPGTVYVDDSLDITSLVIEKLNAKKK